MDDSIRRRSRLGTKRESSPGVWDVRVSNGYKSNGSTKRTASARVYGTERDADRKIAELSADLGRFANLGNGTTLREYWDQIYHPRIVSRSRMRSAKTGKRKMALGTLKRYEGAWRRRIEPAFGDWELSAIRHAPVQAWAYTMTHGEADHSVRVLRTILREAWAYDELIDQQPLPKSVDLPDDAPEQADIWTPAQLVQAMPILHGLPIEPLWLVMAGGGLRREEAYALWWRDLAFSDDEAGCLCMVPVDDAYTVDDGRKDVKTPRGRRVVPIGEPFSSRLRQLQGDPDAQICPLNIHRIPYAWKLMWAERPRKGAGNGKYYRGCMTDHGTGEPILPFVQLRTMRHSHECLMAAYLDDADNSLLHGHSREVSYAHYRRMDVERAAQAAMAAGRDLACG